MPNFDTDGGKLVT
jgi:hypothetical protein